MTVLGFVNGGIQDVSLETVQSIKKVMGGGLGREDIGGGYIQKADQTVTLSSGLVAYDLQAPAKNLYPVLTPIRNRLPRKVRGSGAGDAAHWKEVSAIQGSGVASMGWVPEGQRSGRMSITSADKSATYKTLGEETDVSFEAQSAGEGFEDVLSTSGMRLLQQTMIKEEYALLGGNASVDLGTPTAPTVTPEATGGSIAAGTYNVAVVALTQEGYLVASIADGVKQQVTVTGQDGKNFTINGGSSNKSATTSTGALGGATNLIKASTPAIRGAVAYAWYVGTAGSEKLEAITTTNSVLLTALAGTGQDLADVTADRSKNASLGFDGLLYHVFKSGSQGYYNALATGSEGTGTGLTASGRGTITEIDVMLLNMWDNYRISPEEIYVSGQEMKNIIAKTFTDGANPLVRFMIDANNMNPTYVAGQVVGWYFNPYTMNGGQAIPIRLHPHLAKGTILAWAQNLPGFYQSNNVPNTAEVMCRRDYYQIPWPLITRANETGVYTEEVLACYAPFALGVITNIGDA